MFDRLHRTIDYLRISVTDKCNLRCVYCMPATGVTRLPHEDVLSLEEITEVARVAVDLGVRKVRLTGGEPLVRKGIVDLVAMLREVDGIQDLAMTTNGIRLANFAPALAEAGLQRVNISLDTVDPERYAAITRGGDVCDVFDGIDAAVAAGLLPVKLNCVVSGSLDEPDPQGVTAFAQERGLDLRYIKKMTLAAGEFSEVVGGTGGDCTICNRLRLLCNGMVRPCLFNDIEFSVRELGARQALLQAVQAKPERGRTSNGQFHSIGG